MENLLGDNKNPSLVSERCEVAKGVFEPYILKEEARVVKRPCSHYLEGGVSCKHPDRDEFLNQVDGLGFDTVKVGDWIRLDVPPYIPVVSRDFFDLPGSTLDFDVVGVTLTGIVNSPPSSKVIANQKRLRVSPNLEINDDILNSPVFKGKKVILFLSGKDVLIEEFWHLALPSGKDFFNRISEMGFYAVVAPDFSTYGDECSFRNAYSLKKSLKSFEYLLEAGVAAVPHIYTVNTHHIERWITWLKENSVVDLISINAQLHNPKDFKSITELVSSLENNLKSTPRVLLEGPSLALLKELRDFAPFIKVAQMRKVAVFDHRSLETHHRKRQRELAGNFWGVSRPSSESQASVSISQHSPNKKAQGS